VASRRLFVLFVATTLAPAIGLGWLGWRMVEQDRALEKQRAQERRDHAADLGAAALERALAEIEERLTSVFSAPPAARNDSTRKSGKLSEGVAIVAFGPQGILDHAGVPLPYYPAVPPTAEPSPAVFAPAEALEFQGPATAGAIRVLNRLAHAKDPAVRGGALVRLARNYRKSGDFPRALAAFHELGALADTPVNGLPAGILAAQGSALLLEALGKHEGLQRQAFLLDADLRNGRWLLTRASYEFAKEQTRRWLGKGARDSEERDRLALAEAAESVWKEWQAAARAETSTRGRLTLWTQGQSVLVLSRSSPGRLAVSLVGRQFLQSVWLAGLRSLRAAQHVDFALTDAEGRPVLGHPEAPVSYQSVRTASATRLPWTVHAISAANGEPSSRRRMLLAGIAMMGLLILGGGYLVNRAISREATVAKLQADFVAAVSHEFRTPLTTMRQLSELLAQDRVSSDDRRRQFYQVLLRESDRLHRLVEGLLNFGRMDAGEMRYRFEPLDPAALVRDVVAEFRQEASKTGYQIELQESGGLPPIRADRESLARVFWNLLDNAVKYSPECRTVWVELAGMGKRIMVRVRDRGLGIPPEEQRQIFRKFVRGATSKVAAIQGTGVGLAMARQIVEAHGGEISVESKPGEGSVFTVLLPLAG
jgi:signal transduction histidine kinase